MKLRSRILRPGFYQNEVLATLKPYVRLLYAGLWLLADREGRIEDRPLRIKALLFPYEKVDIDSGLNELHDSGFLIRYEVDKIPCLWLPTFKNHQQVYHNEPESQLPEYQEDKAIRKLSVSYPVAYNKNKSKNKSKNRLPPPKTFDDIPPDKIAEIKNDYPNVDFDLEFKKCKDWWAGGKKELKRPVSALRNWLDKAKPKSRPKERTPEELYGRNH